MSAQRFVERVKYYERLENPSGPGPWSNQWSVRIELESGKEFTFYNQPQESFDLSLDLLQDVIGPDDVIPEEYHDVAVDLSQSSTMFAVWLADTKDDPPHNFKLLCSQDAQDNFNEEIYPTGENGDSFMHDG